MEDKKVILLFSDLEGTILNDEEGRYAEEDMYGLLEQIERMQSITGAEVHIHLVSPVFEKQMEKIIDDIDTNIIRYNIKNKEKTRIKEIEGGTCTPEIGVSSSYKKFNNKVVPFKPPIKCKDADVSLYGKESYVMNWCEYYSEKGRLKTAIYCGNGRNDSLAMKYVKKKANGFVVCPVNSKDEAKNQADFISEKADLKGITEGIFKINNGIEKAVHSHEEKASKIKDDYDLEIY